MSKKTEAKKNVKKTTKKIVEKSTIKSIESSKEISKGDFLLADFIGRIKDTNEIFDITLEDVAKKEKVHNEKTTYSPRLIIVGENWVVKGLESEIEKMKIGEEKTVEISPQDAFGERDNNAIKVLPLREFKKQKVKPYPGMRLRLGRSSAIVKSVSSGRVTLDYNLPLAGKTLIYTVKINKKLIEDIEKIKALIGWRIEDQTVLEGFKINLTASNLKIEIPEKAFLNEGLQYDKKGIARDVYKYLPNIKSISFIENYQKESVETSSS